MRGTKTAVVTFRVDEHLARALDRLPDKSSFIREALLRSLHEPCPACGGEGRVDCDAAGWLREVLEREQARRCACCGTAFPPSAASAAPHDGPAHEARCAHCGPEGHRH